MFKWWKRFDEWTDKWIIDKIHKTGLAGKGPWIIYRCRKCWGAFFETDIIGSGAEGISVRDGKKKFGFCPKCRDNKWDMAVMTKWERFKFTMIIMLWRK